MQLAGNKSSCRWENFGGDILEIFLEDYGGDLARGTDMKTTQISDISQAHLESSENLNR